MDGAASVRHAARAARVELEIFARRGGRRFRNSSPPSRIPERVGGGGGWPLALPGRDSLEWKSLAGLESLEARKSHC